jgi:hypothetical protein
MADAENAFTEALAIRRALAQRDPGAYRPDVAMTLINLGAVYGAIGRMADAETAFTDSGREPKVKKWRLAEGPR